MKISTRFAALALQWSLASAIQLADDPLTYFDGVNNDAYLNWLSTNEIETKYNSSVYIPSIDPGLGAAVHWKADDEYFYVAVAARASGWVGFGLSDVGGMLGSDFALFSVNRPLEIVDAHAVETYYPKEDDCKGDWVYVSSAVTSAPVEVTRVDGLPESVTSTLGEDFIMFETRRKLVTDDPQDLPIIRDNITAIAEQRIIAAWGDTPDVSFHGSNVARGSIRVYKDEVDEPSFDEAMAKHANASFFLGAKDYEIPSENETTYADFCITRNDLIEMGVPDTQDLMSIIGFKPVVDPGPSGAHVHHYIVTGKFNASDAACDQGPGFDLVFVWAPGDGGLALPDFLGANLFGEKGFQSFNIEIHYDNPRYTAGLVDNSGVEIFYTTAHRPVEVGVLQVGDPFVSLFGQPVGGGLTGHHFGCPGSCSDLYLNDGEPVTVIREYLHMHIAGTRTTNEHIRNGTVIRTAATEVWEFDQNGNVPVKQQPFEIYPGDEFRMSCYYRGEDKTVFGLGSREEMCMAFLYYYPRKTLEIDHPDGTFELPWFCAHGFDWMDDACNSSYEPEGVIESDEGMHRLFGKQPAQCLLASDASASEPAIILNPPEVPEVEVPSPPIDESMMETETSKTVPDPAPETREQDESAEKPAEDGLDAVVESISSATSMFRGAALFSALFVAALL